VVAGPDLQHDIEAPVQIALGLLVVILRSISPGAEPGGTLALNRKFARDQEETE